MKVERLTPKTNNVKDSCSFKYNNKNYIMGTNLNGGGLSIFIETNNPNSETKYEFYDVGLHGWTWAWAPFIMIKDNILYVFFNDIYKESNGWTEVCNNQRFKYLIYDIENKKWGEVNRVKLDDDSFGVIDGFIKKVNNKFYLLYVNVQTTIIKKYWSFIPKCIQDKFKLYRHKRNTPWDMYYAISDNMFGPYKTKGKLIKPENKIEEAPNWVETDYIYWSENDSNVGSFIRRAKIDIELDNSLTTIKDLNFKVEWMLAATTTHPDMTDDGKLRATIRDLTEQNLIFYIGEITL